MSEIGIKDQCFGVEVEMTGITRRQAAEALAVYFGTSPQYLGTYYDTWGVTDPEGKVWKLMSDSSIKPEKKTAGGYISASGTDSREYQVEMVTPKLTYAELPKLRMCAEYQLFASLPLVHCRRAAIGRETGSRPFAPGRQETLYRVRRVFSPQVKPGEILPGLRRTHEKNQSRTAQAETEG